jgi:hypothetical protein
MSTTLDIAFRRYERTDRDGCVFLLHRGGDGRRVAKGRFLPDGSLELRDGAVPDESTQARLEKAALAFQKCASESKAAIADACKKAFADAAGRFAEAAVKGAASATLPEPAKSEPKADKPRRAPKTPKADDKG